MTQLEQVVSDWATEQEEEGYEGAVSDLQQHGCQSGVVSDLIYYSDTTTFYNEHQGEIDEMLAETCADSGQSPSELFGDKWDDSDPLARHHFNKNLLAWFSFEETANRLFPEA